MNMACTINRSGIKFGRFWIINIYVCVVVIP
jgi:hypothetical protein